MKNHTMRSNEAGVSESIGFMLIFTIVIAGIALVTLYGYPLLLQQQLGAEEKIMEKNMIVLQNDMKSLVYKTVPYKETALKIGGGSLTVYNSSYTPSSSALDVTFAGTKYVDSFKPGELRYESVSAQTDISLQNGAVVMRPRNQNGSTMLAEPRWFLDVNPITGERTMVINLINVTSDDIMAKEGIGTVRMTLGKTNYMYNKTPGTLRIDYFPLSAQDYSVARDNYFTTKLGMNNVSLTRFELTNVDTLVIKQYEVNIEAV
jgi:hypothetical protein